MASAEIPPLAKANNFFAVSLYKNFIKEEAGNIFFSPFSISTAMAMLLCGSKDITAKEMHECLGFNNAGVKEDEIKTCFKNMLAKLESDQDSYKLACANALLSDKDYTIHQEYKKLLLNSFKALLKEVDFKNESENAVAFINTWVNERTCGMIKKLLDSVPSETVMILLNAIYFKGSWLHKFHEMGTIKCNFYNKGNENDCKQVDTMHISKKFLYAEKETYKAIELPYQGDEISMLIILPNAKDGLQSLEQSLSLKFLEDLLQSMTKTIVEVALPKFRLEYSKSLKEHFQDLGMRRLFEGGAHFGGISDSGDLFVSEVVHKAVVVVNEEGTEAVAGLGLLGGGRIRIPEFIADHPFLFFIYNNNSKLVLFMGRVNEL